MNVIGDQATWHRPFDAPLTSDIASLAVAVSGWVKSIRRAEDTQREVVEAVEAAGRTPGKVATLIVPADCQWNNAGEATATRSLRLESRWFDKGAVTRAAKLLREGAPAALLFGGAAMNERGQMTAGRIATASGCKLVRETFAPRMEHGAGLPVMERLPYFPEQALEMMMSFRDRRHARSSRILRLPEHAEPVDTRGPHGRDSGGY